LFASQRPLAGRTKGGSMKTWNKFLLSILDDQQQVDFLQRMFGQSMRNVALVSGDLHGALDEPSEDAGSSCAEDKK
jgi:hypothetical protein